MTPRPSALILASRSPRRAGILSSLGLAFETLPADVSEIRRRSETPASYARRMAGEKADAVALHRPGSLVLAADTVVHMGNRVFGKPGSRTEARAILTALRGKTHRVTTALCLRRGRWRHLAHATTRVRFRRFSDADIKRYLATGEAGDKAGAYGVQGMGGLLLVERLEGSYTNVVGLPVELLLKMLARARWKD